jgi:Leucine-rich repeat (LRR) protein
MANGILATDSLQTSKGLYAIDEKDHNLPTDSTYQSAVGRYITLPTTRTNRLKQTENWKTQFNTPKFLPSTILTKGQVQASENKMKGDLQTDSLVLVNFYNALNGKFWVNKTNWLTGRLSTWYGITIDENKQRVSAIELPENRLKGIIDNTIGLSQLDYLSVLDLSNEPDQLVQGEYGYEDYYWYDKSYRPQHWNSLSGNIQTALDSLISLRYLDLSFNLLENKLPELNSGASAIEYIFLNDNYFSGPAPSTWSKLNQLKELDLSNNTLSGALPSGWSSLSELETFVGKKNQLNGSLPSEWAKLPKLKKLDLSFNNLSGMLPSEWGSMPELTHLDLSNNQLTGSFPIDWKNLKKMAALFLNNNLFGEPLPPEWGQIATLSLLNLSFNVLDDPLPSEWAQLKNLTWLDLSTNLLDDLLPSSWGGMTSLNFLDLSNNKLSYPMPSEWANMVALRELYLNNNKLDDELPLTWKDLKHLKILYLNDNLLQNPLPAQWAEMDSLQILILSNNLLDDPLPEEWGNMKSIKGISLLKNRLKDPLPTLWGNMATLEYLNLSENLLAEPLPANWGNMKKLRTLNISQNKLNDPLPPEWQGMSQLEYLNLSANELKDALPEEWGSMDSLTFLDLSNNQLDDQLPANWSQMARLTYLNLNNNRLDDALPASWGEMPELKILRLENNLLDDPLPDEWGNFQRLNYLELANNKLDDPLPDWSKNKSLLLINLSKNALDNQLTDGFGSISSLNYLILANNMITGTLPESWSKLSQLKYLDLGNNQISGALPASWNKLTALQELYLQNNKLSSAIPAEWGSLKRLEAIHLEGNYIFGQLPEEMGNWKNLKYINLNGGNVTGSFPKGLNGNYVHGINLNNNNISSLPQFNSTYEAKFMTPMINYYNHSFYPHNYFLLPDCFYPHHFIDTYPDTYPLYYERTTLPQLFNVANNKLEFDDLERNVFLINSLGGFNSASVSYIPQDTIYKEVDILLIAGEEESITIPCRGTNNYYKWLKDDVQIAVPDKDKIQINNVQPSHAGDYHTEVTNKAIPDLKLISYATHVSTLSKTDITCFGANDGSLTFTFIDSNTMGYTYSIDNGSTWQSEPTFFNLKPDSYPVLALKNGTDTIKPRSQINIIEPNAIAIDNIEIQQANCPGDSTYITVKASGGKGVYLFGINDSIVGNSSYYSVFKPEGGNHLFTVQDENGCKSTPKSIAFPKIEPIVFLSPAVTFVNPYMNEKGGLSINAVGNNLRYSVDQGGNWQNENLFKNLEGGYYDLWVVDQNNCLAKYEGNPVRVPIIPRPIDLIIVDGKLDPRLVFKGLELVDESRLRIFTNWGASEIFDVFNYQNDFDFSGFPAGTYFYRLDYTIDSTPYYIKSFVEVIKKY